MLFRKDLSIVLVATYFSFSHAALQLSIDTATCQDVAYTIVGSSQEMASLPATGMIYYKGQTQPFNLDTSTLSNGSSGKESTLNGSVIYHQDLNLVDGPVLVTVQIGSPDATLTGASLVTSCNSTQPSTSSVSESLSPVSTTSAAAETSSSSMVPVNTSISETLSVTPIPTVETVQTSILSVLSTAMPDVTSTSSAEEHKDKIRIEEGASVGVLGVLFLIVVLSGCAYVRRQNKRARMQRTWQTTEPFVSGSRDSFTQVRSVA